MKALAKSGDFAPVPVLLGSNRDEGSTFTHLSLTGNETDLIFWLENTLGANSSQIASILKLYPPKRYPF